MARNRDYSIAAVAIDKQPTTTTYPIKAWNTHSVLTAPQLQYGLNFVKKEATTEKGNQTDLCSRRF
jgi:hypothetical protein